MTDIDVEHRQALRVLLCDEIANIYELKGDDDPVALLMACGDIIAGVLGSVDMDDKDKKAFSRDYLGSLRKVVEHEIKEAPSRYTQSKPH